MFIELNYPDAMGSMCPFCGRTLQLTMADRQRVEYPDMSANTKTYKCQCANNHLAFVKITTENRDDIYTYYKTLFVYERDWRDLHGYTE